MGLNELTQLFNKLEPVKQNAGFQFSATAIPKFDNHRIGKDCTENPALLLSVEDGKEQIIPNLRLQNVTVIFNQICSVQHGKDIFKKKFTVIAFTGKDVGLREYFFRLCFDLLEIVGNSPNQNTIRNEIANFIELLRLCTAPPLKSLQGLWSELLIISTSRDKRKALSCWHSLPVERFDFNDGYERLEVKSSSLDSRIHDFSLEQLNPPEETRSLVASLFVKQASTGQNIRMLQDQIVSALGMEHELIEKLRFQIATTLGSMVLESEKIFFDYQHACSSIAFFNVSEIPKIADKDISGLVTDVRFKSDLSLCNKITPENIGIVNGLFQAL